MMSQFQITDLLVDVVRPIHLQFALVLEAVIDNFHQVAIIFSFRIGAGHKQRL